MHRIPTLPHGLKNDYVSVYVAFDPHPSYKGASTHIKHMVKALGEIRGPVLLLTLKSDSKPVWSESVHQYCFASDEPNLLKRAMLFKEWAEAILAQQYNLLIGHFRDVWGGMAVLAFPHIRSVYEVNGLPSIELPYRFPDMAGVTLQKIMRLEAYCLRHASKIITPSHTTSRSLQQRGCSAEKITVIPNGAEVPVFAPRPGYLPEQYMVYVGAMQPWQGIDVLLKSLRYLTDIPLPLVLCSSHTAHQARSFQKYADSLAIAEKIIWLYQLEKKELNLVLQHALFSLAPLTECSRNIDQGCSPLKILESMACGTPVIASKLPAVEEIINHNEDGMLCRAGRPAELARAIRLAIDYPAHMKKLGASARAKIENQFTWHQACTSLQHVYDSILEYSF
jgi:glycosyltransferase involved in cell wall biosynthesis